MVKGGTLHQPFRFSTKPYDEKTGLFYYGYRFYAPAMGRWVNRDPLGFYGGDLNLYGFVQNNPVNFTDPKGLINYGQQSVFDKYLTDPDFFINQPGSINNQSNTYGKCKKSKKPNWVRDPKFWLGVYSAGEGASFVLTGIAMPIGIAGIAGPVSLPATLPASAAMLGAGYLELTHGYESIKEAIRDNERGGKCDCD